MDRGVVSLERVRRRALAEASKSPAQAMAMALWRSSMERSMQERFTRYVFERIKARNTTRKVVMSENRIVIEGAGVEDSLYIYPLFRSISDPLKQLSSEIRGAISEICEGARHHIYLVYPRIELSAKHIIIKSEVLERLDRGYSLKLVPYVCDMGQLLNSTKENMIYE